MTDKYVEIIKPDDWHVHLREKNVLEKVLPFSYQNFKRALVMPNLKTPITTLDMAASYYEEIVANIPSRIEFTPLLTLYLSDEISVNLIKSLSNHRFIKAIKMYPKGATTNSELGVSDFNSYYRIFEAMEKYGLVLCIHGEVTDENIDVFDREKVFIDSVLSGILKTFPNLKVVLEHITTKEAVEFVSNKNGSLAATITLHHLLINRNKLLSQRIRPHFYCAPILKTETDRKMLVEAATSGMGKFFLGTDSAPHLEKDKISPCGCAGVFTSPVTMEYLVQLFYDLGKIEMLENFTSINGAMFYGEATKGEKVRYRYTNIPKKRHKSIKIKNEELYIFDPSIDLHWERES